MWAEKRAGKAHTARSDGGCFYSASPLFYSWVFMGARGGRTRIPVIFQSLIKTHKQGHVGKDGPLSSQGVPEESAVSL